MTYRVMLPRWSRDDRRSALTKVFGGLAIWTFIAFGATGYRLGLLLALTFTYVINTVLSWAVQNRHRYTEWALTGE